jgi:hypothetical protein
MTVNASWLLLSTRTSLEHTGWHSQRIVQVIRQAELRNSPSHNTRPSQMGANFSTDMETSLAMGACERQQHCSQVGKAPKLVKVATMSNTGEHTTQLRKPRLPRVDHTGSNLGRQKSPMSSLASCPDDMTRPDDDTSGTAGDPVGCCPVGASAAGAARSCIAVNRTSSQLA